MGKKKSILENNIRKLRFENNELSQSDLADQVGVSRQTIIAIEKGSYSPSLELAFKIAYVFNKKIEDVFIFDTSKLEEGIQKL
jgi:putative transcriptional regulator